MKSIFQIQSELNANEKLTSNEAINIIGGWRRNRSRKSRLEAPTTTIVYTVSRSIVAEGSGAAEDDKRRQRPGGGTTTTSPIS
jgi:hypothetical protein